MIDPANYWTVLVPYAGTNATEWHPTTDVPPFDVLTRGVFASEEDAIAWAREHLGGFPYRTKHVVDA